MRNCIPIQRDTDDFDRLIAGYVLANRVNDMAAKPTSKRYRRYLRLVREQWAGEPVIDQDDEYREKARVLVPRALDALEYRDGTTIRRDLLFRHRDPAVKIAALPDGIEPPMVGITVHVRQTEESYTEAVEAGISPAMERFAQAMMVITGMQYWYHLNYFEDPARRVRRLREHLSTFDRRHASELENTMLAFLLRTRQGEAA